VGVYALALLAVAHTATAATLTARVDRGEVVLGESVTLEVASSQPLDALTLDKLNAEFEVLDVSRGTRVAGGRTTHTLHAALYPRRSGRVRVPVLRAGDARSAAIDVTVRESGAGIPRVMFRVGIEPGAPHVRAAEVLYLDIYAGGDLLWSAPEVQPAPGVHLRALAGSQRSETIDGESFTVQRFAWAATALRDGPVEIDFAPLRAGKFGRRLRYSVPKFSYTAQPVPAYLPVYVPVGAPEIRVESLPEPLVVGRPVNWSFTLRGGNLSANGLAQLLGATLGAGEGVRLYAPVIEAIDDAPRQTFRVTLPLQALRHGEVELPEVSIPFYDAANARMGAVALQTQRVVATDPLRQTLRGLLGVAVTLALLAWPARRGVAWWRRRRHHAALMARVERAQSAHEMKAALLGFSVEVDAPRTLRQWRRRVGAVGELDDFIARAERACYGTGADADEIGRLRADARRVLRAALANPVTARSPGSRSPSR
jgi:hypothetical protein